MNQPRRALHMSRRDFLRAFGAAAATFVSADLPQVAGKNAYGRAGAGRLSQIVQVLRIGILLPVSRTYPLLEENLIAGMSLYFNLHRQRNRNYQVQPIPEKIGAAQGSTYQKARRLLRDDKVHLVVGVISPEIAAQLRNLFHENRIPLIVSNAGANVVSTSDHNPYVFYNSLSYWHSNWAAGAWAAQELGKKAVVATSFYDSGYDTLNAFRLGFEAAGGEIAGVAVTHGPDQDKDLSSLPDLIKQARPDFMYALYGGKMAKDFCQAFSESGFNRRIPLACSGFMVEDSILPQLGTDVLDVKSVFSWARGLDNAANKRFVGSYETRMGRLADPFALLGYDTAGLIDHVMCDNDDALSKMEGLRDALADATIASPRGAVTLASHTDYPSSPLYLRQVQLRGGMPQNIVISELTALNPPSDFTVASAIAPDGLKTGFLNAYLAA